LQALIACGRYRFTYLKRISEPTHKAINAFFCTLIFKNYMSIKQKYKVRSIQNFECKEWLLYKHYAKRIPSISYAFGLFDNDNILQGVCTFGMPCRRYNNGGNIFDNQIEIPTYELNRLVINDNLEKNTLSFFLSETFSLLPSPICLVSYADPNNGHNGYIYQATNWLYSGIAESGGKSFDWILNGKYLHGRNMTVEYLKQLCGARYDPKKNIYENFETIGGEVHSQVGKHRYFMFLGNKKQVLEMKQKLKYPILPYPKGENKRYDSSYQVKPQANLF
jgi:hypothetical protein